MLSITILFVTRKYKHLFWTNMGSKRKCLIHMGNVVLLKTPKCPQLLFGELFEVFGRCKSQKLF